MVVFGLDRKSIEIQSTANTMFTRLSDFSDFLELPGPEEIVQTDFPESLETMTRQSRESTEIPESRRDRRLREKR